MSLHDDLTRLAYEHRDLAEAIEEVLKPIGESIDRMQWKGPHRERVRTELGTVTRAARTVAEVLHDRARLIEGAAAEVPDHSLGGDMGHILKDMGEVIAGPGGWNTYSKEHYVDPLVRLAALYRQLTPMGPAVAELFAKHGIR